jgi:ribosomal protein L40E
MSADTSFSPRVCPSCGRENPKEATRCGYCLAPLPWGAEMIAVPPAREEAEFPRPRPKAELSPRHTAQVLVIVSCVFGVVSLGAGFLLFVALVPAFMHLIWAMKTSPESHHEMSINRFSPWITAVGVAFLVLVSVAITFATVCSAGGFIVLAPAIGRPSSDGYGMDYQNKALLVACGFGLATAGGVAYVVVRYLFPLKRP